jgi:hypothetical protein
VAFVLINFDAMKKIKELLSVFLLILTTSTFAQEKAEHERLIKTTVEAINSQNAALLMPYLAEDFSMAGKSGRTAKSVLNALILQLKDSVIAYKVVRPYTTPTQIIICEMFYKSKGKREAVFTINTKNELQALELFKMEVQTLDSKSSDWILPSQDVIKVPFKRAGNLIVVNALVNNEPKFFLVDNGAPKLILNNRYFSSTTQEGGKLISSVQGVNGSVANIGAFKVEHFNWQGIQLKNKVILSMDLSHLEKELKTTIHGLIGQEVIGQYDILFDYANATLTLIKPEKSERYCVDSLNIKQMAYANLQREAHLLVVPLTTSGKTYQMGIDCGAETNLMSQTYYPVLEKQLKKKRKRSLSGVDKEKKKVSSGCIPTIEVGKKVFEKQRFIFNEMEHLNDGYKIQLDGLVGYEVLSQQKTLLSYVNKRLTFLE